MNRHYLPHRRYCKCNNQGSFSIKSLKTLWVVDFLQTQNFKVAVIYPILVYQQPVKKNV